jgi:capsule polysaccharide export protein KpsE/RkpR
MRIQEMCYELRSLARKEEDLPKKDLYYQSAKALEILSNMIKMGDLIVAELALFQYIDLKTRHGAEDDYKYWHDKREYKE